MDLSEACEKYRYLPVFNIDIRHTKDLRFQSPISRHLDPRTKVPVSTDIPYNLLVYGLLEANDSLPSEGSTKYGNRKSWEKINHPTGNPHREELW